MSKQRKAPAIALPLREACVVAAREYIAERGIESLSLRDIARKLGVSHQAPYKHFANRDELLAEVMRRCFEQFAAHLDARERFDDPRDDLGSLGRQYLDYAHHHVLEYRLMFGTPWPEGAADAALVRDASHAFDILRGVLRRVHGDHPQQRELVDLDALFIWSSMHGLAGVMHGDSIDKLGIAPAVLQRATMHIMDMVGRGLSAPR